MNDQEIMLKMMRFWLFGTFIIIMTSVTVYIGGALGTGLMIFRELYYWLSVIITAALCFTWYFLYSWYLGRFDNK
jgi:hypothetical protein